MSNTCFADRRGNAFSRLEVTTTRGLVQCYVGAQGTALFICFVVCFFAVLIPVVSQCLFCLLCFCSLSLCLRAIS